MEGQIAKNQWATFLNDFDKMHRGNEVRIVIMEREFGDQEEAAWLPLNGISYDPHRDQIIVTVGGISGRYPAHLTHIISQSSRLTVVEPSGGVQSSILIETPDDTKTLVQFRRPPQLTA